MTKGQAIVTLLIEDRAISQQGKITKASFERSKQAVADLGLSPDDAQFVLTIMGFEFLTGGKP